jgi:CheY-like chemotaxis protein
MRKSDILSNNMLCHLHLSNEIENRKSDSMYHAFGLESNKEPAQKKTVTVEDDCLIKNLPLAVNDQSLAKATKIVSGVQMKLTYDFTGKTVLAVDDVSFNLSLIELFFRNTGAQILFAANGREAVDTCISTPYIDIVLMDIQMPVMNGIDATYEIHKHNPAMPVIAITAFVHSSDKQRCFDAGCIDFLPKPCRREDLLRTVNNFL